MIPRLVLGLAAAAFLLLPTPTPWSFAGLVALVGVAVGVQAVRAPGSVAPLVLLALGVLEWLAAVEDPGGLRAVSFGLAGFLVHRAAALGAVVPAGGAVAGSVLLHWTGTSALAAVIGTGAVALTAPLEGQPNSTALVLGGLLGAGSLLSLPAVVRRWSRT